MAYCKVCNIVQLHQNMLTFQQQEAELTKATLDLSSKAQKLQNLPKNGPSQLSCATHMRLCWCLVAAIQDSCFHPFLKAPYWHPRHMVVLANHPTGISEVSQKFQSPLFKQLRNWPFTCLRQKTRIGI